MSFILRFAALFSFTAALTSIPEDKWRKYNKRLTVLYFIVTAVIFLL